MENEVQREFCGTCRKYNKCNIHCVIEILGGDDCITVSEAIFENTTPKFKKKIIKATALTKPYGKSSSR